MNNMTSALLKNNVPLLKLAFAAGKKSEDFDDWLDHTIERAESLPPKEQACTSKIYTGSNVR